MKIAILTLPPHTNYGGILQAYALQTILQRMGHKVDILQKIRGRVHHPLILPLVYLRRLAKKIMIDRNIIIFAERIQRRESPILEQHISKFFLKHLNLRYIKSLHDIDSNDYNVIVVGSDQIWRRPYFRSWGLPIKDAFLDFTHNWKIKRIAYAASFGTDNLNEYSQSEIAECKHAAKFFDAISVRENSGITICHDKLAVKAEFVLDPTMLLEKEDYMSLVNQFNAPKSCGDMLCYILDPTPFKDKMIHKISKEKELTPFYLEPETYNREIPIENRIKPSVESWLRGFMDAKFVVTDSFHACVFSIIFGKPFMVVANENRGISRFTSLLRAFHCEECLVFPNDKISQIPIFLNKDVPNLLKYYKKKSFEFLNQNIPTETT